MRNVFFLSISIFIFSYNLFGQKYIRDSVIIDFPSEKKFNLFKIDMIIDNRKTDHHILNITEKNKYVFVPVDFYYCADDKISNKISYIFDDSSTNKKAGFDIHIDHFWLSRQNGFSLSNNKFNASIRIYKNYDDKKYLIGSLVYDHYLKKSIFQKTEKKYSELIDYWIKDFSIDLNELSISDDLENTKLLYNLKSPDFIYQKNLYTGFDISAGINWWCIDLELLFSEPEADKTFIRTGKMIRYRNDKNFESLEFGFVTDYLYHRIHKNWLLNIKIKPFIGINKWKDINEVDHGLEDIFLLDLSFSQKVLFNKLDKKCITFGLGLSENVYYIINHDFMFQIGVLLNIGIKL